MIAGTRCVSFCVGLIICIAAQIGGAETKDAIPSVSFQPYPIPASRTYTTASCGQPADGTEEAGPFPNDFPPNITVAIETGREAEGGGRFLILARNSLRVYSTRKVRSAPYKTIQGSIAALEEVLKRRGAKVTAKKAAALQKRDALVDYPPRNAGHLIEAKISYLEAPWGSGVFYISQFVQGIGEAPNNQQLVYLFQGMTKDGAFFVSADFQISHPSVPARPEDTPDDQEAAEVLCVKVEKELEKATDRSFTPSLQAIRDWVAGLKIE